MKFISTLTFVGVLLVQTTKEYSTTQTNLTTETVPIFRIIAVKEETFFIFNTYLQKGSTHISFNNEYAADFDCFESTNACVIVGNMYAKVVTFANNTLRLESGSYSFSSDPSPDTFVWMRTKAIRKSKYFLVGVSTKLGLHRFQLGEPTKFSNLQLISEFENKDKFIRDMAIIKDSPYVLLSAIGYPGLVQIDYTQMTKKKT